MHSPTKRPKLSRESIVQCAIEIAGSGGLDSLSMRALADAMDVGVMSLYRYVADKSELIQEMTAEITHRHPYPAIPNVAWQQRVITAANIDWELYHQHPWLVLSLTSPRVSSSPESQESLRWLTTAFTDAGASLVAARAASITVWNLLAGSALALVADHLAQVPDKRHPIQIPDDRWETARRLLMTGIQIICDGIQQRQPRVNEPVPEGSSR